MMRWGRWSSSLRFRTLLTCFLASAHIFICRSRLPETQTIMCEEINVVYVILCCLLCRVGLKSIICCYLLNSLHTQSFSDKLFFYTVVFWTFVCRITERNQLLFAIWGLVVVDKIECIAKSDENWRFIFNLHWNGQICVLFVYNMIK
jgi:hypothetical protein